MSDERVELEQYCPCCQARTKALMTRDQAQGVVSHLTAQLVGLPMSAWRGVFAPKIPPSAEN